MAINRLGLLSGTRCGWRSSDSGYRAGLAWDGDQPTPATRRDFIRMAIKRLRLPSGTFVAMVECSVALIFLDCCLGSVSGRAFGSRLGMLIGSVWCTALMSDRRSLYTCTETARAIGAGVR